MVQSISIIGIISMTQIILVTQFKGLLSITVYESFAPSYLDDSKDLNDSKDLVHLKVNGDSKDLHDSKDLDLRISVIPMISRFKNSL